MQAWLSRYSVMNKSETNCPVGLWFLVQWMKGRCLTSMCQIVNIGTRLAQTDTLAVLDWVLISFCSFCSIQR